MGREPISAPDFELGRLPVRPRKARAWRLLLIAVVVSVGVHIAGALLIVLLPRVLPSDPPPKEQGAVELLMVEQKGTEASRPDQPKETKPTPPVPEKKAEAPKPPQPQPEKPEQKPVEARAAPAPPVPDEAPAPPTTEQTPPRDEKPKETTEAKDAKPVETKPDQVADAKPVPPTPPPQPAKQAPVFDLAGTESESSAIALGKDIIPAMPDNRFRNRPPIFPREAEMRNQSGTVDLLIHVSPAGVATGVDVISSSGVDALDQAAIDAVMKWHFRPALQEGQAVRFDMPFRFVFEPAYGEQR